MIFADPVEEKIITSLAHLQDQSSADLHRATGQPDYRLSKITIDRILKEGLITSARSHGVELFRLVPAMLESPDNPEPEE